MYTILRKYPTLGSYISVGDHNKLFMIGEVYVMYRMTVKQRSL
jgi:hypothetical protein